jgi:sec-independent protein translocase protein TatA
MGPLGFQEILVIFIIALIVFGPKKLPELGKSLGKGLREFKKATEDLKTNFEDQIRDAENSIQDVKHAVTSTSTPNEVKGSLEAAPAEKAEAEKAQAEKVAEPHEPSNEPIHPK